MSLQKKSAVPDGPLPEDLVRRLGKHVSSPKALALLCVTTLACLCPMLLALRFWSAVPVLIETGLIGVNGQDDSLPRWALFFLIPGLFCLLNLICHGQLWLNQQRMTLPKPPVRIFGRWFFPIISAPLTYFWTLRAAKLSPTVYAYLPILLGLGLLLLGARSFDCPRDAWAPLRFSSAECSDAVWAKSHVAAAFVYFAAGLVCIAGAMLADRFMLAAAPLAIAALLIPVLYTVIAERNDYTL